MTSRGSVIGGFPFLLAGPGIIGGSRVIGGPGVIGGHGVVGGGGGFGGRNRVRQEVVRRRLCWKPAGSFLVGLFYARGGGGRSGLAGQGFRGEHEPVVAQ